MRFAIGTSTDFYFNGFNRYVLIGHEPVSQWSRNHAVIFDNKHDALRFIEKYGAHRELHLVEMMPIAT